MPGPIEEVLIESFDSSRHAALLAGWLRAPHVERWWGDPQKNLEEILKGSACEGHAIVVADGASVGYIRWQRPTRAELDEAGLREIPETAMDIDIAIGELDYTCHGVGSRALRQLVESLSGDDSIPLFMLATSVDNSVAIRAFERAGFRCLRRFHDPGYDECWLMGLETTPVQHARLPNTIRA